MVGAPDVRLAAGAIVVPLAASAGYASLAAPVLRGRRWARITAWASSALLASCCGLTGLVYVWLDADMTRGADPSPSWRDHYLTAYSIANVVVLLTSATLLALPASNRYFAARRAVA
jgi:hypothetical protein